MVSSLSIVSSTVGQGSRDTKFFSPKFSQISSDRWGVIGDINWARVLAAVSLACVPASDFAKLFVKL